MNSIIDNLLTSLERGKEIETELPDGSSITVDPDDVPEDAEEQVFDEQAILAIESAVDIDEKVLEALITNGEILSDIDLALEAFKYSGLGMDDLTYNAIHRTYNRIAGDLKLPSIEDALYSVDGDRSLVVLATEATVAKRAGDVIKKLVETVLNLFRRIKDWYIRVFDQSAREKRRSIKVHKLASSLEGAPMDATVTMKNVNFIGVNGKPLEPGQYLSRLVMIKDLTSKLTKDVSTDYSTLIGELSTITKVQVNEVLDALGKRDDESLSTSRNSVEVPKVFVQNDDKLMERFIQHFRLMIEKLDLSKVPKDDDQRFSAPNTVYHLSEVLPGNKQMSSAHPEKTEETVADLGKIKNSFGIGLVDVGEPKKKIQASPETAFDTLSLIDIKRIAEEASEICDLINGYKQNYTERERQTDKFLRELQVISRNNDDLDATARQSINSIVSGATAINKNMMNGEGRWIKYVMDIVIHSLDWCVDSMAQYDHGKMN